MRYAATIGFFDGVHIGHHFLLDKLKSVASQEGVDSAVITFDKHPQVVLRGNAPGLLTTYEERINLLRNQGVGQIFCFNFEVIRDMTALEFMRILHNQCDVDILLMGYDHRFGSECLTGIDNYQALGQQCGVRVVPMSCAPQGNVSSTKIRNAVMNGDIALADSMLGYPYTLTGKVVHGKGLGKTIGFPTANLQVDETKLLPLSGVYAAKTMNHDAIVNIGTNPTVNGSCLTVEVHILDWSESLYESDISVQLLRRIRSERKFDSLEDLKKQIAGDIAALRKE